MTTYQSPVLAPADIPQIALDSMNNTHQEEVALINELGSLLEQAMQENSDGAAITTKLDEWVEHTRAHFASENELMQKYGFPAYAIHSGEHAHMLEKIDALQQQWQNKHEVKPLADFIFDAWPNWFMMHVNSMDMVTAQFLRPLVA